MKKPIYDSIVELSMATRYCSSINERMFSNTLSAFNTKSPTSYSLTYNKLINELETNHMFFEEILRQELWDEQEY